MPARPNDDVTAFDRQLLRAASGRAAEAESPQLGALLRTVAERRARRVGGAGPAAPPPADAGTRSTPQGARHVAARAGTPGAVWSVEDVGAEVRIIRTARPAGLSFRAGQYVKFGIEGVRRGSYSIASAPHEPHLEFCVELIPGGRLTPALFRLAPGDGVDVREKAKGKFVLDADARCHLMVATVTGIAPLRSMLRDALHQGTTAEFVVLHGASHASELPYLDELTELAATDARVRYVPTVSRPDAAANARWTGETGRVDDLACRVSGTLDPRVTHVYACGHPQMVKRVKGELGGSFALSSEVFD